MDLTFTAIQQFLLHHIWLAPFMYIALHILCAICFIPCSPMAIIAGVLWGKWLGLSFSITGALLASCTTFALARWCMRTPIYNFLNKRYSKTDWFLEQTQKHGWKFVASVQLNPIAPASTLGYLFGVTAIEFSTYASLTLALMLPLQILLVVLGDSFAKAYVGKLSWSIFAIFLIGIITLLLFKKRKK